MQRDKNVLEREILKTVRQAPETLKPQEVVSRVTKSAEEEKTARAAIRSLVDKGDLLVTLDWTLRVVE